MKLGTLEFNPVENNLSLISDVARETIEKLGLEGVLVAEIDDNFSDTAAFCAITRLSRVFVSTA